MVLFVLEIIFVLLCPWESRVASSGCMRHPPMSTPVSRPRFPPSLSLFFFFPSIPSLNSFSSFLYAIQITGSLWPPLTTRSLMIQTNNLLPQLVGSRCAFHNLREYLLLSISLTLQDGEAPTERHDVGSLAKLGAFTV